MQPTHIESNYDFNSVPTTEPVQRRSVKRKKNTEFRGVGTIRKVGKTYRRNEKCPCGSGKKFKNCHLGANSDGNS